MNVDIHVHPLLIREVLNKHKNLLDCVKKIFGLRMAPQPLDILLRQMEIAQIDKAVLLAIDCHRRWACKLPSNEDVAELVEMNPERFIGFGSVDPLKGKEAARELEDAVKNLGLSGLKIYPGLQDFDPLCKEAFIVYEKAQELKIPVLVHVGLSWQRVCRLKYCEPRIWDDIAINFPDLNIILAHFGWPWVWDTAVLAIKNPNVYIDISNTFTGTPLEHFRLLFNNMMPPRITERFLFNKILFGSDYPRIEMNKMASDFRKIQLNKECKTKILSENATKLLDL